MIKYIIILFFLINNYLYSQTVFGEVKDSITNKPLELVNIAYLEDNYGTSTDNEGYFKINLIHFNKIQISSVGYVTKIINLKNYNKNENHQLNIELSPRIEDLEEIIISVTKTKYSSVKVIGPKKTLKVRTSLPFGYEFCSLIKNNFNKKGKIKSVILNLNKVKGYDYLASYNIKFYKYDNTNKVPSDEIYHKNLIIEPENKTYKLKIDVDSLSIPFPIEGICVGIEVVNTKYKKPINRMAIIAPKINFTHTDFEILTWKRYRNKEWKTGTTKSQVRKDFVNALTNLEVRIKK